MAKDITAIEEQELENTNELNIELTEEMADGIYSNLAIITHSPQEFVLDFIKIMPGVAKAKVKSRIVITPQHAKRFARALMENINRYESIHGEIIEPEGDMFGGSMPFSGPAAQA